MKIDTHLKMQKLKTGHLDIEVLNTGDIRLICSKDIMINQLLSNYLEGMVANIYLRVKKEGKYEFTRLLGVQSPSQFEIKNNQIIYQGVFKDIDYQVYLSYVDDKWFFDVFLKNISNEISQVDVIYGQDVGIANAGAVRSNEAYTCQYIDHSVFQSNNGFVVCSRQNQEQSTGFPYLQQGSLTPTVAYATDGFQFFGLDYKVINQPQALLKDTLESKVYQYEFAYTCLQSETVMLDDTAHFIFYSCFKPNISTAITSLRFQDEIMQAYKSITYQPKSKLKRFLLDVDFNKTLVSKTFSRKEIEALYPKRFHQEYEKENLLSFFTEHHEHVVLQTKESYVERSHGHIIISGNYQNMQQGVLASTNYMYGLFNGQTVIGNTSFNKLLSNARNPLNVSKIAGQRIFVKINNQYRLLTMPGVYELGMNYAKWLYKVEDDIIEVIVYSATELPKLKLQVQSIMGKSYQYLISHQVCLSPEEYEANIRVHRDNQTLTFIFDDEVISKQRYPNIQFRMVIEGVNFTMHDDRIFYHSKESMNEPMVVVETEGTNYFDMIIEGQLEQASCKQPIRSFQNEVTAYRKLINNGICNFKLSTTKKEMKEEVDKFNHLRSWYSHNALVHYASPHGLEQYGGAAWGTRDVCQGPFEYFIVTQQYDIVKEILCTLFMHQSETDGNWPQWFMFDNYMDIRADESHGDIIVWPLKAVAHYLEVTDDFGILDTLLPYTCKETKQFTKQKETLWQHLQKEIQYIKNNFIKGTHLSCYGDGDWDDTLQPANDQLRNNMVSGWTVILTYQAIRQLAKVLTNVKPNDSNALFELAENIKKDYYKYVIKDDVAAGFLLMKEGTIKYLLHPRDKETGLRYRLLPMTRGIIGEMFTKELADKQYQCIREHLYYPDGVRLMDKTCAYHGGVNTYFKRAETAANFGREVGLLYVHAQIRFIEAMAKLGHSNEVWEGLLKINPITIQNHVSNAMRRQSNSYFSSSDGAFLNRYEAMEDFDLLKTGNIAVKGGWRIYSSGPGIYINQLISQCLGLRFEGKQVILDPVLPTKLDGLCFDYCIESKPVTIRYHLQQAHGVKKILIDGKAISFTEYQQPYRLPGAMFDKSEVKNNSIIDVYV